MRTLSEIQNLLRQEIHERETVEHEVFFNARAGVNPTPNEVNKLNEARNEVAMLKNALRKLTVT